jgi:hypothetical protein
VEASEGQHCWPHGDHEQGSLQGQGPVVHAPASKTTRKKSPPSVGSVDEYVDIMNNLKLPNPKMMDVAVPANMQVGLHQDEIARKGWAVSAAEAVALHSRPRRRDRRPARDERA